jgi:hypothetical protein
VRTIFIEWKEKNYAIRTAFMEVNLFSASARHAIFAPEASNFAVKYRIELGAVMVRGKSSKYP